MNKFSNKLKKPCCGLFGVFFLNFWEKKIFSENPALSRTTSYEFLAPCQISQKTNDTIPRKCLDRRTNRPYFIRPFRLPLGVQKLTNMKTYRWTQKQRKNFKNQHCLLSMLVPKIEYLYYPLNVEGVTLKG